MKRIRVKVSRKTVSINDKKHKLMTLETKYNLKWKRHYERRKLEDERAIRRDHQKQ
jgi:hypothetical protein